MENWQEAGFGLYVHWPFCAAKCPYCDFNSHVSDAVDQERWKAALLSDIDHWADRTGPRVLTSIFFGGGTPSMMPPDTVAAIIDKARTRWTAANDMEVTLEANPTSADAARFAGYVDGGVNRFSVGLQALNDQDLKRLGRLHTASEGRAAFDLARTLVDRVSCDLIYARQDQSPADWEAELLHALDFAGEHLSLYQLTIEDGTAFGRRHAQGGLAGLPDEDRSVDLWHITQDLTNAAGLPRYETSNHAAPGAESRHNQIYWCGGDWVGVGPGAHGRLTLPDGRHATEAAKFPAAWLDRVAKAGTGTIGDTILPRTEVADEMLLMGLRLNSGLDLDRYFRAGGHLDDGGLGRMVEQGFVEMDADTLRATDAGSLLLNAVLVELSPSTP
ncbi:radical SAM family heme chaperone HemW [Jannaschia donghaensis]|uniref:Heme chaperone HemW n=1 Tax=Jannaschia donghaensis TaxID=420998 RepID=A0A0M6YI38_9RHOB|nr:radical SAM family heme chaperone HemW [Jannaschia donghaensis]CTQ49183.1 Oxygen-independent coproporphyrinogen-III oxidase 1 [Jannaschia donghaensis]